MVLVCTERCPSDILDSSYIINTHTHTHTHTLFAWTCLPFLLSVVIVMSLILSMHVQEGYSTQFVSQSVRQSVSQSITWISKMAASQRLKQALKCCTGHFKSLQYARIGL